MVSLALFLFIFYFSSFVSLASLCPHGCGGQLLLVLPCWSSVGKVYVFYVTFGLYLTCLIPSCDCTNCPGPMCNDLQPFSALCSAAAYGLWVPVGCQYNPALHVCTLCLLHTMMNCFVLVMTGCYVMDCFLMFRLHALIPSRLQWPLLNWHYSFFFFYLFYSFFNTTVQ